MFFPHNPRGVILSGARKRAVEEPALSLPKGELLTRDLANHLSNGLLEVSNVRAQDIDELLGWIIEYWSDDLADLGGHFKSGHMWSLQNRP